MSTLPLLPSLSVMWNDMLTRLAVWREILRLVMVSGFEIQLHPRSKTLHKSRTCLRSAALQLH
jgi:hypothetical protein